MPPEARLQAGLASWPVKRKNYAYGIRNLTTLRGTRIRHTGEGRGAWVSLNKWRISRATPEIWTKLYEINRYYVIFIMLSISVVPVSINHPEWGNRP